MYYFKNDQTPGSFDIPQTVAHEMTARHWVELCNLIMNFPHLPKILNLNI